VAPAIPVENISSPTAFAEYHPTVVGLFPSGENRPSFNSASDALPSTPAGTGGFMSRQYRSMMQRWK
jgi:hypothetical protein